VVVCYTASKSPLAIGPCDAIVGEARLSIEVFRLAAPAALLSLGRAEAPLLVLVVPIEFISKFMVRPFSLSVRLLANMMAGHILLTAVALLAAATWTLSIPEAPLLPFLVALNVAVILFELLVVVLQAYIFTILTAVYIAESRTPEH